jgi:plastocyanin
MKLAEGMEINLFASEAMFPRLINPVQMAVDTNSRLWASVWPSYPHWKPTEPRRDALLILPDEDRDGIADECIVFADQLNSVTGFEFWGGGVLVAAPPEIWFLKDTDGDDRADVKLRMLQGISSADTHHTANAMLIGPDGWLYWSRGIFNVANLETPTRTYRSSQSGVHRFNPRTFEVEFHFPIGPNPHGDVFDRWGYQFANDGTSGTGSYVNIGRGVSNKQWFEKRVRPVSSTGILSSEHFPAKNNNNFLICNTIGFLGVLQHRVNYNGADITATEIEPILVSSDPNFRPSDLEIGGDGALYVSDWHNVLIGHMQHNMRDPNRDHEHGRIYRVTAKGRKLLKPARLKEKPVAEVCKHLLSPTNSVRYRARIEMSGRDTSEVVAMIKTFTARLSPRNAFPDRDEAQALLECLWVLEEHRTPDVSLVETTFQAREPRVRAAAIRTLGHWAGKIDGWQSILQSAARDESPLVRAEAVKAATCFPKYPASEVILEVASRPVDPELNTVISYAAKEIDIESLIKEMILSGTRLSPPARKYALQNMAVEDLLKLPLDQEIFRTVLNRKNVTVEELELTLRQLARLTNRNSLDLLLELLTDPQSQSSVHMFGLGELLVKHSSAELAAFNGQLQNMATNGATAEIKSLGYAAWIIADRSGDNPFLAASNNKRELRCFLEAISNIPDNLKTALYEKVRPLIFSSALNSTDSQKDFFPAPPGIHVDYFYPSLDNVKAETLDRLDPTASGFVHNISLDVPQRTPTDKFSLRFSGVLHITTPGKYQFFTVSDDGSRLYINRQLVVDNDGLHGMLKKKGAIELPVGRYPWTLNYFNHGGDEGLKVTWSGPGFDEQPIPPDRLTTANSESLQEKAIRTLGIIPRQESQKIRDLVQVLKTGQHLPAAISALRSIPIDHWSANQVRPVIDNLIGYLSEMPARYRTGQPAKEAVALARSLSAILSPDDSLELEDRLENLDVRVIAIGTIAHRMIYDKEKIVVQAGAPVEFRFSNTDAMPHNFAILLPGALQEVGELAEATSRQADAADRHYIPKSDKILLASHLLQPGQNQTLTFRIPTQPGVFPYVCTYPGHWRRMFGALYVVQDLSRYQADPESYLANNPLPVKDDLLIRNTRAREWTFDDLQAEVNKLRQGRSFEVGQELFKVASCVGCHKLNNQGRVFGPDLVKLDPKKKTVETILQSILEPSRDIDKKFQSYTFLLDSGKVVTGMIVAGERGHRSARQGQANGP